jgi:hypothetical protein
MTRWGAGGVPFVDPCHNIVGKTGLVMVAVQEAPLCMVIAYLLAFMYNLPQIFTFF